jgi:hypothetical protein
MPEDTSNVPDRLRLLQALADGQMPEEARRQLEPTLSAAERRYVEEEKRIISAAATVMNDSGPPEELWRSLRERMLAPRSREERQAPVVARLKWRWAAAAAVVLAVIGAVVWTWPTGQDWAAYVDQRTTRPLDELAREVETPADPAAVAALLRERGFASLVDGVTKLAGTTRADGHEILFLGATTQRWQGEEGILLLIECCGQPVQVLLVARSSTASKKLAALSADSRATGWNLTVRDVGPARAVFMGRHDARGLLGLLG